MEAIIDKAFNELNLESIYWCVSRENERAVRFYDKHNFFMKSLISRRKFLRDTEGLKNLSGTR